jgi:hypothetical protein
LKQAKAKTGKRGWETSSPHSRSSSSSSSSRERERERERERISPRRDAREDEALEDL